MKTLHPALGLSALLALGATTAHSAVLDYAVSGPPVTENGVIADSYGDVAGLVDVTHRYVDTLGVASGGLAWWGSGYDDLVGVAWAGLQGGGDRGRITLASVDGSLVQLNGFDLGVWSSGRGVSETVTVTEIGSSVPLHSWVFQENANRHWSFNVGATSRTGFVIEWTSPWWVAIDNLDSTAAPVPEPAASALMLLGLAGLGLAARRRR